MAEENQGPFRRKSLERLSSPERLDQLLRVVDRKSWLPLLALFLLVAGLACWAVFGRVPVNAHGGAILVHPREVVEIHAPGDGYLVRWTVGEGDRVEPGDELGRIDRPDLEQELALQRQKATQLAEQLRNVDLAGAGESRAARENAGADLEAARRYAAAFRALTTRLRDGELRAIAGERRLLEERRQLAGELHDSLLQRLESRRRLHREGILSREELVGAEIELTESMERLSESEADLWSLRTRELDAEEQYLQRMERITDREQQIAEVAREISRLEQVLEEEGRIVNGHGGTILEIRVAEGEYLARGERIASMSVSAGEAGFVCMGYFTVRDGKRLRPGMKIQVSPDPVERQRFGSMLGRITHVTPFPVTLDEVGRVVGNREVAEALTAGERRIQVRAELEADPATFSGFLWSSSRGPRLAITPGTTATARVAVERRAPITFVLPILRSAAGVD